MTALHRAGILFSSKENAETEVSLGTPPMNLSFLEVLSQFVDKLSDEEKKTTLKFLEKQLQCDIKILKGSNWLPLQNYRECLMERKKSKGRKAGKKTSTPSRKNQLDITKTTIQRPNVDERSTRNTDDEGSSTEMSSVPSIEDYSASSATPPSGSSSLGTKSSSRKGMDTIEEADETSP